jgi:hypothetical protein
MSGRHAAVGTEYFRVRTQRGTCILSSFGHLEFWSGSYISGKLVTSCLNNLPTELHNTNLPVMLMSHCILKCFFYKQFILKNFVDTAPYSTHTHDAAQREQWRWHHVLRATLCMQESSDLRVVTSLTKNRFIHPIYCILVICITIFLIFQLATSIYFP